MSGKAYEFNGASGLSLFRWRNLGRVSNRFDNARLMFSAKCRVAVELRLRLNIFWYEENNSGANGLFFVTNGWLPSPDGCLIPIAFAGATNRHSWTQITELSEARP